MPESPLPLIICLPIYNDWESASQLIRLLDQAKCPEAGELQVLLVDDGSQQAPFQTLDLGAGRIRQVEILRLRRNVGHQRAIAIGLGFIHEHRPCQAVVVMDGDGEDTPEGMTQLIERFYYHATPYTIFAQRARRTENWFFKGCLALFKMIHWLLTGRFVKVGNFSILPAEHLDCLVGVSELWNHYAASVVKAGIPHELVPINRGRRLASGSHMNFTALVIHGLSAISVFADVVGVRLLIGTFVLALLSLAGLVLVTTIRFSTDLAIPGWASTVVSNLMIIFLQAFLLSLMFVFITLQGRAGSNFLPVRDYAYYINRVEKVHLHEKVRLHD